MSIYTTTRRYGLALLAVATGWLATLSGVMVLSDAAPGAIVLLPAAGTVDRLPPGAALVASGRFWIGVRSDEPGLGRALYRAGGTLVLPAGLPGCLPLPGPG